MAETLDAIIFFFNMTIKKYQTLLISIIALLSTIIITYLTYLSIPIIYDCCISPIDDSNSTGEIAFLTTFYLLFSPIAIYSTNRILKNKGNTLKIFVISFIIIILNIISLYMTELGILLFYIFMFSPLLLPLIYRTKKITASNSV